MGCTKCGKIAGQVDDNNDSGLLIALAGIGSLGLLYKLLKKDDQNKIKW